MFPPHQKLSFFKQRAANHGGPQAKNNVNFSFTGENKLFNDQVKDIFSREGSRRSSNRYD